jgi:hypothetical protein
LFIEVLAPQFIVTNVVNVEHFYVVVHFLNHCLTNTKVIGVIEGAFEGRQAEEYYHSGMVSTNDLKDFLVTLV